MSNLERLARMLTGSIGTPTPFDGAMIAGALRAAHDFDEDVRAAYDALGCDADELTHSAPFERTSSAFLAALAEAFDGNGSPVATVRAGKKGNQAKPKNALGVTDEALAVYEFITENAGPREQDKYIKRVADGEWPGGNVMSYDTAKKHFQDVRVAKAHIRAEIDRRRKARAESS